MKVFGPNAIGEIAAKTRRLLQDLGYAVEHDGLSARLQKSGLNTASTGRFVFDDAIIDDFVAQRIEKNLRREAEERSTAAVSGRSRRPFRTGFGNEASKYYDYGGGTAVTGRMEHLETLTRFAHASDRIGGIGNPVIATDIPAVTAPIEELLAMMQITDKHPRRLEPYTANQISHFVELSEILLGPGRQNEFVGHCDCINPILRLEERAAGVMLEKAKYGIGNLITSMPAAGGNAPVTVDGAVIEGTAEVLGALIIAWLLNPETRHRGYISSGIIDMRAAATTQSAPETVLIDCGVAEVMEHAFGGDIGIGGRTYISATRPGLQAVFERLLKSGAYARMTGEWSYAGAGILDNGSLISPEQLILDLEIGESLHHVGPVDPRREDIGAVIAGVAMTGNRDFLSADHTLENFRGAFWEPRLFTRGRTRTEREILDEAHREFVSVVESYRGYDPNNAEVKAVAGVLKRAKEELL